MTMGNYDDDGDDEDCDLNPLLIPSTPIKSRASSLTSPLNPRIKEQSDDADRHNDQPTPSFNHLMIPSPRLVKSKEGLNRMQTPPSLQNKKRGGASKKDASNTPAFEVLSMSKMRLIKEPKRDITKTSTASKAQDAEITTQEESLSQEKDYQKTYWKKKTEAHQEQEKKAREEAAPFKQGQAVAEEAQLRGRAIFFRDEMNGWQSKIGTGEYDDSVIQANIDQLEREFYGIDFKYRP